MPNIIPPSRPQRPAPNPVNDPVELRAAAINNIIGSWDLEGARPDEADMRIIYEYGEGRIDLDEMLTQLREAPLD
ncbi:MAG TPA: antitoxin VbhA family protein [Candidatus Lumbricidophila sp.]|nr:antitoxin VbhA family protein [Candidatus Lumbricidophila sp.]